MWNLTNFNSFSLFRQLLFPFFSSIVWLSWNFVRFRGILFQTDAESFSFEKQKSFIPKKKLSRCQYQNKKAFFTDPIFSEGFWEKYLHIFIHNHSSSFGVHSSTDSSSLVMSLKSSSLSSIKEESNSSSSFLAFFFLAAFSLAFLLACLSIRQCLYSFRCWGFFR